MSTYYLPKLIYGCEIMSRSSVNIHDIGTVWNNAFRHIFNCSWRESVKPLQYFWQSRPLSYLINERRLMFFRKLLVHDKDACCVTCSVLWVYWCL